MEDLLYSSPPATVYVIQDLSADHIHVDIHAGVRGPQGTAETTPVYITHNTTVNLHIDGSLGGTGTLRSGPSVIPSSAKGGDLRIAVDYDPYAMGIVRTTAVTVGDCTACDVPDHGAPCYLQICKGTLGPPSPATGLDIEDCGVIAEEYVGGSPYIGVGRPSFQNG